LSLILDFLFRNKRKLARNEFLFSLFERKTVRRAAGVHAAIMRMNELESTFLVQRLFQVFTLGFAIRSGQVDSAGDSKNLLPTSSFTWLSEKGSGVVTTSRPPELAVSSTKNGTPA
jgi:hypothetical protein